MPLLMRNMTRFHKDFVRGGGSRLYGGVNSPSALSDQRNEKCAARLTSLAFKTEAQTCALLLLNIVKNIEIDMFGTWVLLVPPKEKGLLQVTCV